MTRVGRALWRLLGGHVDDGLTPTPPFEPPDGWVVVYDGDAESAAALDAELAFQGLEVWREAGVLAVPESLDHTARVQLSRVLHDDDGPDEKRKGRHRTVAQFATRREVDTAVAELEEAGLNPLVVDMSDAAFGGPAYVVRVRERHLGVAADLLRAIAEEHPWFRPLDLPPDR